MENKELDQKEIDLVHLEVYKKLKSLVSKYGVTLQEIRAFVSGEINHFEQKYGLKDKKGKR